LSPPLHFGNQDARIAKEFHLELERERKGENSSNVADDDMPELEMAGGEPSLWNSMRMSWVCIGWKNNLRERKMRNNKSTRKRKP
jgi:hypothetical protein